MDKDTNDRRDLDSKELYDRLREAKHAVSDEGRPEAVEYQRNRDGALTARERIEYLCDTGSFDEIGQLAAPAPNTPETQDWTREDAPADGVITGWGEIDGRTVAITATDFTVKGGSIGHTGGEKMVRVAELACRYGFPLILLQDGGGHRIQEGLDARTFAHGDVGMLQLQQRMSGWVPMVSAMMGYGFAAATNYAAMCNFIPMVEGTSTMGVAGPKLVKAALGVERSKQELGGANFQTAETGMADLACADDEGCLDAIKRFLSYLPQNANAALPTVDNYSPPRKEQIDSLTEIIPADTKKAYDMHDIIRGVIDRESFFEYKPAYAKNIITGFGRLEGDPIGIVASNPRIKAGTVDVGVADKASQFVSMCDAFGLPLVFLLDIPGVMPGPDSEREGIALHSGKIIFEIARASVPKVHVVVRRAYGFGYSCMGGGDVTDNELTLAWPTAEIAAMGIEGAVDIAYKKEIENADDPDAKREELIKKFTNRTGPIRAAEDLGVDAAIDPSNTRDWIIRAFDRFEESVDDNSPPKKHDINPI